MQLDPNIILQAKGIQLDNPMEVYGRALNLKQLANQNMAQEAEMQKKQILSQAVKTSMTPDGKIDHQQVFGKLSQVDPMMAQDYVKKAQADAIQKQTQDHGVMKMLWGSADPNNLKPVKLQLQKAGVDGWDQLPDQMTPQEFERIGQGLLTWEDQQKQKNNERDFGLKEREVRAKELEVGKKDKAAIASVAEGLRKERSGLPTTKATQDVSAAFNKIQKSMEKPSAAGDMSMIFGYMKMLDPGSTVREGEFANAQNATGVPGQVLNAYNRALKGERLNEEQRKDFYGQAQGLYQSQLDIQNQVDAQFSELASKNGIDPKEVILNFQANDPGVKPKWAK